MDAPFRPIGDLPDWSASWLSVSVSWPATRRWPEPRSALGLAPPPSQPAAATGKTRGASNGSKQQRRRKPATRALRAARLLRGADSPGGGASATVQEAVESPATAGSAANVIRPAAREAARS